MVPAVGARDFQELPLEVERSAWILYLELALAVHGGLGVEFRAHEDLETSVEPAAAVRADWPAFPYLYAR